MKRKISIILSTVVIGVLVCVLYLNYKSSIKKADAFKVLVSKEDKLYLSIDSAKKILSKIPPRIEEEESSTQIMEDIPNSTKSRVKKSRNIYIYRSSSYDIEYPNGSVKRVDEITYHTFDFDKKIVIQASPENGKKIEITYPFKNMNTESGLLSDAKTYVLKVGTLGCKEIWWSPDVPNLGYDYDDGRRIACYGLSLMKN